MIKNFIKRVLSTINSQFKTSLFERAIKLEKAYHSSNFLNAIRHNIDFAKVKLKYKLRIKDKTLLKLHLGCGDNYFEGYVNIDCRKTKATDLVCDIRKLPYPDNSIELIEIYHAIEHLPRHDLPKALKEWDRVLFPGGKLIIECPDFDEIVKRYLEGDEKQLDGIFALQRFEGDYHLFGYNFKRLRRALKDCGFTNIENKDAQDYHVKEWPCIRVECIKEDASSSLHAQEKLQFRFTGERIVEDKTPKRIWLDHVARYKFAGRYVKEKEILDISCGNGYGSSILCNEKAVEVVGIDISNEAIKFANNKYKKQGIEFKVGNIMKTEYLENYFDVIVCFETIEHVNNQMRALEELKRILRPDGLILISSPNRKLTSSFRSINDVPNNKFHVMEYTTKEFIRQLKKYFEVQEIYGQRAINKIFVLPFVHRLLRLLIPLIYIPSKGNSELERISFFKEYRYVTAICRNKK